MHDPRVGPGTVTYGVGADSKSKRVDLAHAAINSGVIGRCAYG